MTPGSIVNDLARTSLSAALLIVLAGAAGAADLALEDDQEDSVVVYEDGHRFRIGIYDAPIYGYGYVRSYRVRECMLKGYRAYFPSTDRFLGIDGRLHACGAPDSFVEDLFD